jgi:transcriptional regulator with XRE-family HTH domain
VTEPVIRDQIAAQLKRFRREVGASGEEVAEALGWSQPKISRIESGRISISVRDLSILLNYYGVPEEIRAELLTIAADHQGFGGAWIVRAGGTPRRQGEVAAIEPRLSRFLQYNSLVVPGQLHSPEYARAVAELGGWPNPDQIVERRLQRQRLLSSPGAPEYAALLDARAFLAWPGARAVLDSQVAYLRERAQLPNITVRIIPIGIDRSAVAMIPFILYEFKSAPKRRVVFVESQTADVYLSDPMDIKTYSDLFERLSADALDEAESLNYLDSLLVKLDRLNV